MNLKNKKILVTGGNGFIGRSVVKTLMNQGVDKKNIIIPMSKESDLKHFKNSLIVTKNIDIVIHLAGIVGGIGFNQEFPGKLFYDNIIIGVNLIEASRINKVKKLVCIGTVCSYPKFSQTPFREENLWKGYPEETNAPYGIAKKALLTMIQAYRTQYNFKGVYLLLANSYGPNDSFDPKKSHVVAALIKKIFEAKKNRKKEVIIWGDGSATREFIFVDDAAEAIVLATKKYNKSAPINIGTGLEISIKELAGLIKELIGYQGKVVWDRSKPNGQPRRQLDVSLAKKEIGFLAKTTLKEGLIKTISWYDNHY